MRKVALLIIGLLIYSLPVNADDELKNIRIKTDFNIWKVNLSKYDWIGDYSKASWNNIDVELPKYLEESLKSDSESLLQVSTSKGIDESMVKLYLQNIVEPEILREKQDVTISLDEDGEVIFDGFAMSGQEIDYEKAFFLINNAYKTNQEDVRLPIKTINPTINVTSQDLIDKGIVSLLGTGETDFSGSPRNRRTNIAVGLDSFNGTLIPPNEGSTAGKILGRVDASTGYKPELVIKGDKTVPEYGGGLCQVSTTVYRSILFSGLPITERKNHSYAVSYYDPQGLDATIYPPSPDLKFENDTPNHILIQTTTVGDKAYANIYGTPVDRHVDLIGPYYYDYRSAPPAKIEYTTKLAPGEKQIVGGSHAGFKASWYRRISHGDESKEDILEHIFSNYEARPLYTLIGSGEEGSSTQPIGATDNGT